LEAIHHRHNVSAILRSADSVGIQQVHLVRGDFKASKGPARGAERWLDLHHHEQPAAAIERITQAGFDIWIADIAEHAVTPESLPLDRPVCLWFGAEMQGVGPEAHRAAKGVITVPMYGFSQSLNVSVATALVLRSVTERVRRELGPEALLTEARREQLWNQWVTRDTKQAAGIAHRAELQWRIDDS